MRHLSYLIAIFEYNDIGDNPLKKIILLFTLLSAIGGLQTDYSQVTQEWVQRYNGTGNAGDEANCIAVDNSGNIYVTGSSNGSGTNADYVTIKYSPSGTQLWVQRYNGPGNSYDEATSIVVDGSGNVYVTGESYGNGTLYDFTTIKYNTNGIQQWVQRYNGPGNDNDIAYSIALDATGDVFVTGSSVGIGSSTDYATIKYNTNGVQQWVQRYDGPSSLDDEAYSITADGSGNIYVTGRSKTYTSYFDYLTIKYNTEGVPQWVQRYNDSDNNGDGAESIAVDAAGNVFVTGYSELFENYSDCVTIKYNANGVQQWLQRYNCPVNGNDIGRSVALDDMGNVFVTGYSDGGASNLNDYITLKYNASGVQQWLQRYNGPVSGYDEAYSIAVDGSGNVYVIGKSYGSGTNYDYTTIKNSSSGVQQWIISYNGPANGGDEAKAITIDVSGNVYVTGGSTGIGSGLDYATIKYSQPNAIPKITNEIPVQYQLYQNYPNPFNPSTKIKFDIPDFPLMKGVRGMTVRLTIYDLLGREITTLVNQPLQPGTYEVEWEASNYPSGVYFYKLSATGGAGDYTNTKKLVLLK